MEYTCIYCKQKKSDSEFNREHVVSQMMGRYRNGLVLSNFQVCQECNTYFDRTIEDKLGINSYEAFLRMCHGIKKMSDGRQVRGTRIILKGNSGILNGLTLIPVADSAMPERYHFDISPCVGIKKTNDEYDYYSSDEIPNATEEVLDRLREYSDPIIQFGYDKEEIKQLLIEKGYIDDKAIYNEKDLADEYKENEFITKINFTVDSIVKRLCAKTAFNFLCYYTSVDFVLKDTFDPIRNFIRYGTGNDSLWFKTIQGYVQGVTPPNNTAHAIGTMLSIENQNVELVGCITWFGEITYIIKLGNIIPIDTKELDGINLGVLPDMNTKFAFFDNVTTEITYDESTFLYIKK